MLNLSFSGLLIFACVLFQFTSISAKNLTATAVKNALYSSCEKSALAKPCGGALDKLYDTGRFKSFTIEKQVHFDKTSNCKFTWWTDTQVAALNVSKTSVQNALLEIESECVANGLSPTQHTNTSSSADVPTGKGVYVGTLVRAFLTNYLSKQYVVLELELFS
ncbi:expressed protein [Phakopsora pachyrhizi]|uniref:Expressed protein n=1 Tax=Phakopsora pachyrhizi TaxID=170000 RepID=A0AAV0BPW5_PHAPC|nr:expressed protein [Phakopsora pachyrhizi]